MPYIRMLSGGCTPICRRLSSVPSNQDTGRRYSAATRPGQAVQLDNNLGNDLQPLQVPRHEHRSQEDNHTELLLYVRTGAGQSD